MYNLSLSITQLNLDINPIIQGHTTPHTKNYPFKDILKCLHMGCGVALDNWVYIWELILVMVHANSLDITYRSVLVVLCCHMTSIDVSEWSPENQSTHMVVFKQLLIV